MNVFTGVFFAILMVIGWGMVLWLAVILTLGRNVRRKIKSEGYVMPELDLSLIIRAIVFNLATIFLTAGYLFEVVNNWYISHQPYLLAGSTFVVLMATIYNDRLHHLLMAHIAFLDDMKEYRNVVNEKLIKSPF